MDLNSQYFEECWFGLPDAQTQTLSKTPSNAVTYQRDFIIQTLVPEIIGFTIYTIIFVPSFLISLLCLYYLFKNTRRSPLYITVIGFSITISSFNLAAFALRSASAISHVRLSSCPTYGLRANWAFNLSPIDATGLPAADISKIYHTNSLERISTVTSFALVPAFLWLSDAFLVYRAWVVWIGHRRYTFLPGILLLASAVTGIIGLVPLSKFVLSGAELPPQSINLDLAVARWIPALSFSVGLDTLTTGMIAGRLIYHHRMQVKLGGTDASPYRPLVTIFIESAALSLISKIIQMASIPSIAIVANPIVIPLCTISSNLIILRKALGLSAFNNPPKGKPQLPTMQFQSQHSHPPLGASWDGLETLVLRSVGGNSDIGANTGTIRSTDLGDHPDGQS